jgi:double-stranded uracil-DNA glycosylase
MPSPRPNAAALVRARRRTLPDVIAPGLRVLFCGINPGLYSTAIGHHFGRPGNRFWKALHASGFTPRLFSPDEDAALLAYGLGITNLCPRTTASADELTADELARGARELVAKAARYRPRIVAVLGIRAYRLGFDQADATIGRQSAPMAGAVTWVLPNPSGLNAHYRPADLARHFRVLRKVLEAGAGAPPRPPRASARRRR